MTYDVRQAGATSAADGHSRGATCSGAHLHVAVHGRPVFEAAGRDSGGARREAARRSMRRVLILNDVGALRSSPRAHPEKWFSPLWHMLLVCFKTFFYSDAAQVQ